MDHIITDFYYYLSFSFLFQIDSDELMGEDPILVDIKMNWDPQNVFQISMCAV